MFYQSNIESILILLSLFYLILKLIFLDGYIQCAFYSFYNKSPCSVIWEKFFLWVWRFILLSCFCFKNLDLLDRQTTQFDFSLSILFVIFTPCGLKLLVQSLHPKQYVVPIFFPNFIGFIFDCVFFIIRNLPVFFWQSILNTLIFFEWFDLNSNSSNLFERSSISDFSVDFLMCLCILFISLKMLKFFSSGLILINKQSSSFSSAFCLSVSLLRFLLACPNSLIHQLQVYVYESKDQPFSLKYCIEFAYLLLQIHRFYWIYYCLFFSIDHTHGVI